MCRRMFRTESYASMWQIKRKFIENFCYIWCELYAINANIKGIHFHWIILKGINYRIFHGMQNVKSNKFLSKVLIHFYSLIPVFSSVPQSYFRYSFLNFLLVKHFTSLIHTKHFLFILWQTIGMRMKCRNNKTNTTKLI